MNRIFRSPIVNAVCISLFTAFYALIFFISSDWAEFPDSLYYIRHQSESDSFWATWGDFLADSRHVYIAAAMIAVTALVVILLVTRRRPYDEYHVSILTRCLTVASILTLFAIAVFYLIILNNPDGIIEKFTLFIVIHWITVVLSDLTYILICRWR